VADRDKLLCPRSAVKQGFSGYNVDWEPASGVPTIQDAKRYASFLTEFAEVTRLCPELMSC
jgi:trimethylamine:corrinoid methyltransferase-like protein